MQFPDADVPGRAHPQYFTDVDYGRLLGMMKSEDELLFKQDGRSRCVSFSSLPLPLTPPNTRTPYEPNPPQNLPIGRLKENVRDQLLYFYFNHHDVRLPLSLGMNLLSPDQSFSSELPNKSELPDQSHLHGSSPDQSHPSKLSDHSGSPDQSHHPTPSESPDQSHHPELPNMPESPDQFHLSDPPDQSHLSDPPDQSGSKDMPRTSKSTDQSHPSDSPHHPMRCSSLAHLDDLLLWACGPALSTLGVARLTGSTSSAHPPRSFLDWTKSYSPLPLTPLQALNMPGEIRQIEVIKIKGKGCVCVRSDYYLSMFHVSQGLLECSRVYQTQHCIRLSALNPYVFEECVVFTESGELLLISPRSKVTHITTPTGLQPTSLCFGAHPRSVIVAVGNQVYNIDWRSTLSTPISALFKCKHQITCLSHDPSDPFCVVMTTHSHLLLLDVREYDQPMLSVQLNFNAAPTCMYIAPDSPRENLLMVMNAVERQVLGYSRSSPRRLTLLPHSVVDTRSLSNTLRTAGLSCEGQLNYVMYRLTHPIVGATLYCTHMHTAVIMTDLGDVFQQSWTYQATPTSHSNYQLCPNSCHGYNLWLEEAFAQEQELNKYQELNPEESECVEPLADFLLSPETPPHLCINCHYVIKTFLPQINPVAEQPTSPATSDGHCVFCGTVLAPQTFDIQAPGAVLEDKRSEINGPDGLVSLREHCPPFSASTELGHKLLSSWRD